MKPLRLAALALACLWTNWHGWGTLQPAIRAKLGQPPRLSLAPLQLIANGYDSATLTLDEPSAVPPVILIEPAHAATVADLSPAGRGWKAQIRAGVTPATITVRVQLPGRSPAVVRLFTALDLSDSAADGTPDFLRLDDADDARAFRRWFTFLAETQYFEAAARRPAEIVDCAALIRFACREALRAHDGNWATEAHLPLAPGIPSVAKYQYPYTPLGAALFRVKSGGFLPADLAAGAFAQFADAKTLQLRNTHFVTREAARAEPGDLLFYRQSSEHMPFHSMIYLGESQIDRRAGPYLVYHTGPGADGPGEVRRPTLDELRHFPDPSWRPLPDNPRFLGVFRWNILRSTS
jgi:uncharacterized protein YfaT (DUF1175 family)